MRETGGRSGTNVTFPTLTRTKYCDWALAMEVNLQVVCLWDAIEDDTVLPRDDRQALAALIRSTPMEMHNMLAGKVSTKEAWALIKPQRLRNDLVREMNAQRLWAEFETIIFKDGERVEDFAMKITGLATSLCSLGETVDDATIVQKFLHVVPSRFAQVAISIETLLDLSMISIDDLMWRLRVVEDRLDDGRESTNGGRLLLTQEEWEARKRHPRGGGASGSGGGRDRGRGGKDSHGRKPGQLSSRAGQHEVPATTTTGTYAGIVARRATGL